MYLNPRVVIFRDLISDVDIAKIKELATPRVSSTTFLLIVHWNWVLHLELQRVGLSGTTFFLLLLCCPFSKRCYLTCEKPASDIPRRIFLGGIQPYVILHNIITFMVCEKWISYSYWLLDECIIYKYSVFLLFCYWW